MSRADPVYTFDTIPVGARGFAIYLVGGNTQRFGAGVNGSSDFMNPTGYVLIVTQIAVLPQTTVSPGALVVTVDNANVPSFRRQVVVDPALQQYAFTVSSLATIPTYFLVDQNSLVTISTRGINANLPPQTVQVNFMVFGYQLEDSGRELKFEVSNS